MTYTAKTVTELRRIGGSPMKKVAAENALIDTELDTLNTQNDIHKSKFMNLTIGLGTDTAVGTTGIDLASGADIDRYGFFFPVDVTLIAMHDYLTEAYVKETDDAKLEIYDDAGTPVKLFGRTLTSGGEAAKTATSTDPETDKANVDAGTAIMLKAVKTDATSGTGHAIVVVEYVERHT